MATNRLVFKPTHIAKAQEKMTVQIPDRYKKFQGIEEADEYEIDAEGNVVEQYHGPTIEEIEAELERYRKETEEEIRNSLEEAHGRARSIEEQGKTVAFQLNQDAHERAKKDLEKARQDAEQIIERSKLEVERMVKEAEMRVAEIEHEAYQKGYDAGREVGFKKGQSEVRRLIDRLGMIVGQAIDVRKKLFRHLKSRW